MRLINHEYVNSCVQIEVEYSFLFLKFRKCYRLSNGIIMRYKSPDKYYNLSINEYLTIKQLFKMPKPTEPC